MKKKSYSSFTQKTHFPFAMVGPSESRDKGQGLRFPRLLKRCIASGSWRQKRYSSAIPIIFEKSGIGLNEEGGHFGI